MSNFVQKLREHMHMTKTDMAKILKISVSTICNYETERRLPRPRIAHEIIELAKLKGITITLEDLYPRP